MLVHCSMLLRIAATKKVKFTRIMQDNIREVMLNDRGGDDSDGSGGGCRHTITYFD